MKFSETLVCKLFGFALLLPICWVSCCRDDERKILMDFKRGLHDPSGRLKTWNGSTSYCNWEGIKCDTTKHAFNWISAILFGNNPERALQNSNSGVVCGSVLTTKIILYRFGLPIIGKRGRGPTVWLKCIRFRKKVEGCFDTKGMNWFCLSVMLWTCWNLLKAKLMILVPCPKSTLHKNIANISLSGFHGSFSLWCSTSGLLCIVVIFRQGNPKALQASAW